MSSLPDLIVKDITLSKEHEYPNFSFDFTDQKGRIISVKTFLQFYDLLRQSIQTLLNGNKSKYITAEQISILAANIINEHFFDETTQQWQIDAPISISIGYESDPNAQPNSQTISQTNSYLEIIKDISLNYIILTLMDPVYNQVFNIEFSSDMVNSFNVNTFNMNAFDGNTFNMNTPNVNTSNKNSLQHKLQDPNFIEYINNKANSDTMTDVQKKYLQNLITKLKSLQQ